MCPHGGHSRPETCTQCLGIVPRRIYRDPQTELLLIDGVPIEPVQVNGRVVPPPGTRQPKRRGKSFG